MWCPLYFRFLLFAACCFFCSCQKQAPAEPPLFKRLSPSATGIDFANVITENDSVNLLDYEYIYNGGGVAVLDVNLDGWPDLFFSGNMVPSRLYLNLGNMKFKDISAAAGLKARNWATGASVADVNSDGYPDIYVCSAGVYGEASRANVLYINNRDNTFTESARAYGLADTGFSTMAAFLDYDRDGDLDVYLATYANETWDTNVIYPKVTDGSGKGTDKLYRNNGDHTFTNVSQQAGILVEGYALGVAVCDINNDAWPDIYVSNDYTDDDLIYLNNQDGTFTESAGKYLRHISNFAMGNDIADINNDGYADIMVVDMLPEDNERQKLLSGAKNYDKFMMTLDRGYLPAYMRNTLQLNNGNGTFSEIGQLAGVHNTDWSWAPLLADFDNDGYKDLFVSNGYPKDINNRDFSVYSNYSTSPTAQNRMPADLDAQHHIMLQSIRELGGQKLQNYIYRNKGDLTFTDKSDAWGLRELSFSNGAAYADLDRDGDLDLVVNNIDDPAFVYENQARQVNKSRFLQLKLSGDVHNTAALGAKVSVYAARGQVQYQECSPYRGFQSTVESTLHFGLGNIAVLDSLVVRWPDGRHTVRRQVKTNQVLTLRHSDAASAPAARTQPAPALFADVTANYRIDYRHQETDYIDFKLEPLLPHKFSQAGPGIAAGDVNQDGLPDFYVGGSQQFPGWLYLQSPDGGFTGRPLEQTRYNEDLGALFFDADGDGHLDLYVVSGGSEQMAETNYYQDRLYRNDGRGNFTLDAAALPRMYDSGSCVVAADYDQDKDLDLFVGGRVHPGKYPLPAKSYILRNDKGKFTDVSLAAGGKALQRLGLVTAAQWTDFDNDGQQDLVVVGEWMPVSFFKNNQGKFTDVTQQVGLSQTRGWWNSLTSGDFDNDGDMDYVAGNIGGNTRYKPSSREPVRVYARDFDKNGSLDAVLTYYIQGRQQVAHARDEMTDQLNYMRKQFPRYADYAKAAFGEVFTPEALQGAYKLESELFQSVYLENKGGRFGIRPLPKQAQVAPLFGMAALDADQDGNLDLLTVGNSYATEVTIGRYDAAIGLYLKGDGKGNFMPVPATQSGFVTTGDAKGLATLTNPGGQTLVLVSQNAGPLQAFACQQGQGQQVIPLEAQDASVLFTFAGGKKRKQDLPYGSGYLSQSARTLAVPEKATGIRVTSFTGQSRHVPVGLTAQKK